MQRTELNHETMTIEALERDLDIDVGARRARYRAERDKRLRPDGVAQFIDTSGRYAHYREDPWADPDLARPTLTDDVDVLVIGGGLGALLLGANLRKAGVESIGFVERAGDFGGVWYRIAIQGPLATPKPSCIRSCLSDKLPLRSCRCFGHLSAHQPRVRIQRSHGSMNLPHFDARS